MRTTRFCLTIAFLIGVGGCEVNTGSGRGIPGSGVAASDTREVPAFDEVLLRTAGSLEVAIGALTPLELPGDDNLLPLIETRVEDGKLIISCGERIDPQTPLKMKTCNFAAPATSKLTT